MDEPVGTEDVPSANGALPPGSWKPRNDTVRLFIGLLWCRERMAGGFPRGLKTSQWSSKVVRPEYGQEYFIGGKWEGFSISVSIKE